MAIAKSTAVESTPKVFEPSDVATSGISGIPTVQWDILRFFDIDTHDLGVGTTEENLKDIEKWTFKDVDTLGDGLMKLRNLEIQLGTPSGGDTRITRIHRWVQMEHSINDMKARQRSL